MMPNIQLFSQNQAAFAQTPPAVSTRQPRRLSHMVSRRHQLTQPRSIDDSSSLRSIKSNQSLNSEHSAASGHLGTYKLSRVDSRASLESTFSFEERYRVTLELSSKEISLLRYMWTKMLGEEPVYSEDDPESPSKGHGMASALDMPGSIWAQAKAKPAPGAGKTARPTFGASSTFCCQLYSNLLAMDPELETAFPSLRHQAVSMAGVLSLAVSSLENLKNLDAYLMELANRHSRVLGIESAQFELMGEAFIQTFHERFGRRFTHELEVLWIKFYMYLANSLLQFGLDPVMRIRDTVGELEDFGGPDEPQSRMGSVSTYQDSIFTSGADSETDAGSEFTAGYGHRRRESASTEISSVASAVIKPPMISRVSGTSSYSAPKSHAEIMAQLTKPPVPGKSGSVSVASKSASHSGQTKQKRGRIGRKTGECTIM